MRYYDCFDDNCGFGTGQRQEYARHLFEAHTEDQEGVDRHQVVRRIMAQQGIEETR